MTDEEVDRKWQELVAELWELVVGATIRMALVNHDERWVEGE